MRVKHMSAVLWLPKLVSELRKTCLVAQLGVETVLLLSLSLRVARLPRKALAVDTQKDGHLDRKTVDFFCQLQS